MSKTTMFEKWSRELRLERGLFNGERVRMVRESRGMTRYALARKLGMPTKELARREQDWCFWTESEQALLSGFTEFPIAFFVQDDPPVLAPAFMCGHDAEGNDWCDYVEAPEEV